MNYQEEAASIATMNILWMFVYVQTLVFNIFSGTVLVDRAKETALILHRIMCTVSDTEVLEKLYQLSEMLYARQPVLGCGLLVWDWKYLSSVSLMVKSIFVCNQSHQSEFQILISAHRWCLHVSHYINTILREFYKKLDFMRASRI